MKISTHTFSFWGITLYLCLSQLLLTEVQAQSLIIDPEAEGGFELGADFESNGWTVVNYPNETFSNWYVGDTMISNGWNMPNDSRCAYVSNNGGDSWSYLANGKTKASASHFYRDVIFPAAETNITLSFDLVSNGEGFNYDVFYVWLCPVTLSPVNASPVAMSDITVWDGIGIASPIYKKHGTSSNSVKPVTHVIITIPNALAGNCTDSIPMRLVFGWKNDESMNYDIPAAIDNISLVSTTVSPAADLLFYTIDNRIPTSGNNFNDFSSALSWLNAAASCTALTDSIIFDIPAGLVFYEDLPELTAGGAAERPIIFRKMGTGPNPKIRPNGTGAAHDAGVAIHGADHIIFDGIDIHLNTGTALEYGFLIKNASPENGASHITIKNSNITLNKSIIKSIAILQTASDFGGGFEPISYDGANNNNRFEMIVIQNSYNGIMITNASELFPDDSTFVVQCRIGTTYTGIPSGNIGGKGVSVYGIQLKNQSNCNISNNIINNITADGTATRGIYLLNAQGNNTIAGNSIKGLRNTSSTSTSASAGIDAALYSVSGTHNLYIYNNTVSDVTSAHAAASTSTVVLKGIVTGGGTESSIYHIDFNSISIDGSGSLKIGSVALELGSIITTNNVRNNVLANFTAAQTGSASHYAIRTPVSNQMGKVGSVCNYNDYYIANASNGFTALTGANKRNSIGAWKSALTMNPSIDLNSFSGNPMFLNNTTDLHATSSLLNGTANASGIEWVTVDIDGDMREVTPDIGADEFSTTTIDLGLVELVSPAEYDCANTSDSLILKIKNYAAHSIHYLGNPLTIEVAVSGPEAFESTKVITLGALGANAVSAITMPDAIALEIAGTYTFTIIAKAIGDINAINDTLILTREVFPHINLPFTENFDSIPGLPDGWTNTGFSFGTHTGALESQQAYINISETNTYGELIFKKTGTVSENTVLSFDYRVTKFGLEAEAEDAPDWGNILISVSGDCGNTFDELAEITSATLPYTNVIFSLGDYAEKDVIIKIETNLGETETANFWVDIDNIELYFSHCVDTILAGNTFEYPHDIGIISSSHIVNEDNVTMNCWTDTYGHKSPDVFYKFEASCHGDVTISLCGSDFDTELYLLDSTGLLIASNGDFCGEASELSFYAAEAGVSYYVVVEGNDENTGNFTLEISLSPVEDIYYADIDNDGFGDAENFVSFCAGSVQIGYVLNDMDCNDTLSSINPDGIEVCNSLDDDCNGIIDDGLFNYTFYLDADNDGYGSDVDTAYSCYAELAGYALNGLDCNDTIESINPLAAEICDGIDNDCNGFIDDGAAVATILEGAAVAICKGTGTILNANTGVGYTYSWYRNGNIIVGATNAALNTNKAGNYTVQVGIPGGCVALSEQTTLSILNLPNSNIAAPFGLSLCSYVGLSASNGTGFTWAWYRDGNLILGAINRQYNATLPGTYYCVITNANGCSKQSNSLVVTACREELDLPISEEIILYPNPASNSFKLQMPVDKQGKITSQITITGVEGKEYLSRDIEFSENENIIEVPVIDLPDGIYFVSIRMDGKYFMKRLVVIH